MVPHPDSPPTTRIRGPPGPRIIVAMLLALDVGNTNITTGLFRAGALLAARRAATAPRATPDEVELALGGLLGLDDVGLADLDSIVLASVVPADHQRRRGDRRAPRPAAPGRDGGHRPARHPGGSARRRRRGPAGQRAGGGTAVRHAGGRGRFRNRDDLRLRRRRRRLRRRRDRPRPRARARSARRPHGQAAAGRLAHPGPSHRAGHGRRHPVGHRARLPGAGGRPARAGARRARRGERRPGRATSTRSRPAGCRGRRGSGPCAAST